MIHKKCLTLILEQFELPNLPDPFPYIYNEYRCRISPSKIYTGQTLDELQTELRESIRSLLNLEEYVTLKDISMINHWLLNIESTEVSEIDTIKLAITLVKRPRLSLLIRFIKFLPKIELKRQLFELLVWMLNEHAPCISNIEKQYKRLTALISMALKFFGSHDAIKIKYSNAIKMICKIQLISGSITSESMHINSKYWQDTIKCIDSNFESLDDFKKSGVVKNAYSFYRSLTRNYWSAFLVFMLRFDPEPKKVLKLLIGYLNRSILIQDIRKSHRLSTTHSEIDIVIENLAKYISPRNLSVIIAKEIPRTFILQLSLSSLTFLQQFYEDDFRINLIKENTKEFRCLLVKIKNTDTYIYIVEFLFNKFLKEEDSRSSVEKLIKLSVKILEQRGGLIELQRYLLSYTVELNDSFCVVFEAFRRILVNGCVNPFSSRIDSESLVNILARLSVTNKIDLNTIRSALEISMTEISFHSNGFFSSYKLLPILGVIVYESSKSMDCLMQTDLVDYNLLLQTFSENNFDLAYSFAYFEKFEHLTRTIEFSEDNLAKLNEKDVKKDLIKCVTGVYKPSAYAYRKNYNRSIPCDFIHSDTCCYKYFIKMNITIASELAKIGHPKLLDIFPIIPKLDITETFRLLIATRRYSNKQRVNIYDGLIEALSNRLHLLMSDPNTEPIIHKKLDLDYKDLISGGLLQAVSLLPWLFFHDSKYSCALYKSILISNSKTKTKLKLLNIMLKNGYCPLKAINDLIFYERKLKFWHVLPSSLINPKDLKESLQFSISNNNLRKNEVIMLLISRAYHSLLPIFPAISKIIGNYQIMKKMNFVSYDGILKYGKSKDFASYIEENPNSIDRKYDFLIRAIKARNSEIIPQILTYFDNKELYEFLKHNEGESLLDMAYYKLDQIARIIFSALPDDQLYSLSVLTHYNFSVFGLRISIGGYSSAWEPLNFLFSNILLNQHSIILYLQALYKQYTKDIVSFMPADYYKLSSKFDSESSFIDFIHSSIIKSGYAYKKDFIGIVVAFNLFPSIEFFEKLQKKNQIDIFKIYLEPQTRKILRELEVPNSSCRYNSRTQINNEIMLVHYKQLAVYNNDTLLSCSFDVETKHEILHILLACGHFSLFLALLYNGPMDTAHDIIMNINKDITPFNRILLIFAAFFVDVVNSSFLPDALLFFTNNDYTDFKWLHFSLLKSIEISRSCLPLIDSKIISPAPISFFFAKLKAFYIKFYQEAKGLNLKVTVADNLQKFLEPLLKIEQLLLYSNLITCIYEGIEIHKKLNFKELKIVANYSNEDYKIEGVILVSINYCIENDRINLIDSDYYYKKNIDLQMIKAGLTDISRKTEIDLGLEGLVNLIKLETLYQFITYYSDISLQFITEILEFNNNMNILEFEVTTPPEIIQNFAHIELPKQAGMIEIQENVICPPTSRTLYYTVIDQAQSDQYFNFRTGKWIPFISHNHKLIFEKETFLPYLTYILRYKFQCMCNIFRQERYIDINYQSYINNIASPMRRLFKKPISTIFDIQRSQFLHIILYINLYADNFSENKILFIEFTLDNFSVKKYGEVLVFYFPYRIRPELTLENSLELYQPDLDSTTEDFLVHSYTPEEIFARIIDTTAYESLLNTDYKIYGFQFIINWDSIRLHFIPHLTLNQQYKKYINLLQLFDSELKTKLSFMHFHNIFLNSFWDEAMLINGFRSAPDLIAISKIAPEDKFFQGKVQVVNSKREFSVVKENSIAYTVNLNVDDLDEDKLIFVKTTAGNIYCLPRNAFPSVSSENHRIIMPEIGNILNPFPEILSISLNSNDNVRIDLSDVENNPDRISDIDLVKIKSCVEYTSTLKSYFWYTYSLQQEKICNFVLKKMNHQISCKKVVHSRNKTEKHFYKKTVTNWCPQFTINWDSFRSVEIPYKLGMDYANNILNQFYGFLAVLDRLFNSINSDSSFKVFEGNLHFRPKSSFMQKLIMKYLSRLHIKIGNHRETVSFTDKGVKLYLCPAIIFEEIQSDIENNIKVICEYIIKKETLGNLFENISIISKATERTYLEAIESVEVLSQMHIIIKILMFIFRVYLRKNMVRISLNLETSNSKIIISQVRAGRKTFALSLGRNFYNFADAIDLGENLLRKSNLFCPFISRAILKSKFGSLLDSNSKKSFYNYYSDIEFEDDKTNDLLLRRYDYFQNKQKTKKFFVLFSGRYPLGFHQIFPYKDLTNNHYKYKSFCMKTQGNTFKPIVKASKYLKLKTSPESFKTTFVPKGTLFKCYIFTKSHEENFSVKNEKNKKVFFRCSLIKNNTSFEAHRVLLLQFNAARKGCYYIYEDNRLIPADFIVRVSNNISPNCSNLSYMKLDNKFLVTFYDKKSRKVLINQKGKLFTEKTLEIQDHQICINIIGDNQEGTFSEIVGGINSLEFKFKHSPLIKQYSISVCIDNIDVIGSPYILMQEKNFKLIYENYIDIHKNNSNYSNTIKLNINRKRFFESVVQSLKQITSQICGGFKIYYTKEPGSDYGGLKRDFFDCLGCYAMNPEMKLFEAQGDNYRIHPEADIETIYYYGCALANGITHKLKIPISFCDSLIKIILGIDFEFGDLELENPDLFKGLSELNTYSSSQLDSTCLSFTVNQGINCIPLCANGENIYVNTKNLSEYHKLMVEWELFGYAKEKILSFTKGFYSVANSMKGLFTVDEFRYITCKLESNYFEIIQKNITAPLPLNKVRLWLLKWLEAGGEDTVKKFLKFATGSSLIPIGDANRKIELVHIKEDRLPVSHTCFNKIEIPCYQSYEIFCNKMEWALDNSKEKFTIA